jgi:hypothetical protein
MGDSRRASGRFGTERRAQHSQADEDFSGRVFETTLKDSVDMSIDLTPEEEERVRRKIRERGLTFEVFLPEGIANWLKARVAEGAFEDPAEMAFVAFQRFIELYEHPEVEKQLLHAVLDESMNDPRPGIPAEQVHAELEARIRKLAEPDDASE